ncbi:MAG TPA: hypothetical protein PLL09_03820 [Flavobacterium sp.]|uniref:hypothetical protein n=1 Tax=unclassified Flavobacterium TaxID=196869 RepID=UPI000E823375|nr:MULTISPECIES: hypothetical protein [unclassified Flavobacterium]HBI02271.1 hypothetical protein [Flavobacterium sp.]HRE76933.1 hypothetical protein [Flavobacterium sp.]
MKKLITLLVLFATSLAIAQVPQGISYQAIALNASGNPVVNSSVGIRLTILDNASNGTAIYTETQTKTTNAQGLFNLIIGQGTVVSGTFNTINWGTNSKFLKVEMDATGGTNFVTVGTTQLLSVPYAMHAATVSSIAGNSNINDEIIENKTSNYAFMDYYDNKAYAFNTTTDMWSFQSFNTNATPELVTSNGNFGFIDNYDNKAYTYNGKTGVWSSQTFNTNASPVFMISNGSFAFMDYYDNKAYAYNSSTGSWSVQSFNTNATPDFVASNGNFGFIDNYDNNAYVYNSKTGVWSVQPFNTNASPDLVASNRNFSFIDYYDNKVYVCNGRTGVWSSQLFNTNATPTVVISETN